MRSQSAISSRHAANPKGVSQVKIAKTEQVVPMVSIHKQG